MKCVTLVRHAQAESALADQSDYDRALTRRGAEDASEMARRLKQLKPRVDFIVSSPAPRAFATAEIFARVLKISPERLDKEERFYTAGANEFLITLNECDNRHTHILIVAHNPGITDFADKLSAERGIDAMPTCAVVTMQFEIAKWEELAWKTGTDVELDYPSRAS
jgi:phosphohistidine phosphatase